MASAGVTSQLLPRIGSRPVAIAGTVILIAGVLWLSRIAPGSSYAGGILGPTILLGAGPGAVFTAYNGVILHGISSEDSGSASSLLETMQWVGGTLGLSILVTIFGTAARAATQRPPAGLASTALAHYVLIHGMRSVFSVAVVFMVLGLVVTLVGLRTAHPSPEPAAEPETAPVAAGAP